MNIVVCVKQVPDPETPAAAFRIDARTNKVVPAAGVAPVIGPYDLNAVELALRLKEKQGGKVTVICMGTGLVADVVKKPLAMGGDDLVLIDDPNLVEGADSYATAATLAAAIRKVGAFDIVLTGRQAADWDAGQVGSGLAELLGIPAVTLVKKIEVAGGKARVERISGDGHEVYEVALPAVLTATSEECEPRYPVMRGIMAAARKQPIVWKAGDLGLSETAATMAKTVVRRLFVPPQESRCEIVGGTDAAEAAVNLANKLREDNVI